MLDESRSRATTKPCEEIPMVLLLTTNATQNNRKFAEKKKTMADGERKTMAELVAVNGLELEEREGTR